MATSRLKKGVTPVAAQSRSMTNPFKGRTGLDRVVRATGYSLAGLKTAYHGESAFRQEAWIAVVLLPAAFWLGRSNPPNAVRLCLGTPVRRAEVVRGLERIAALLKRPPEADLSVI